MKSNRDAQAATQAAHRDLVLERLEHVRQLGPFNEKELAEAVRRLNDRTGAGDWQDDRYLRQTLGRFRDTPSELATPPQLSCDIPELAVVQLLSRTAPENQFSVTPDGDVFAGHLLGYHYENDRFYVTALSPILDDAADLLLARSGGAGGRMYVRRKLRLVEQADGKTTLAKLKVT